MARFAAPASFLGILLAVQATGRLPLGTEVRGSESPLLLRSGGVRVFGDGFAPRHLPVHRIFQPLLEIRGGGRDGKAGGSRGAGGSRKQGGGARHGRSGRSGKEARKRRVRKKRENPLDVGEQLKEGGGGAASDPAARSTEAAAGATGRSMVEDRIVKEMRAKRSHEAPPLMSKSTFSGLFDLSPPVYLPGHTGLTLEHFRGERRKVDDDGKELPKLTYS